MEAGWYNILECRTVEVPCTLTAIRLYISFLFFSVNSKLVRETSLPIFFFFFRNKDKKGRVRGLWKTYDTRARIAYRLPLLLRLLRPKTLVDGGGR